MKKYLEKNKPDNVHFVIKNYKYANKRGMTVMEITSDTWQKIRTFTKINPTAKISVAVDYSVVKYVNWKDSKQHYLRERDDFLLFKLAQYYKRKYMTPIIVSNDKFKDFEKFGYIPQFTTVHFGKKEVQELVKPRPNALGQFNDYKVIKLEF